MYFSTKRALDVVVSMFLITLTAPIWLIAVLGIGLSSPGPLIYVAKRIGRDGKVFDMYKFRSMHIERSEDEADFKPNPRRVFKFGAFIRSMKIDELPQLINVLLGQMSLVGPRPVSVDQASIMRSGMFEAINLINVGITSPSAIYDYIYGDRIQNEFEYVVRVLPTRLVLELYYLQKCGFWYDMKILTYTALCIIMRAIHKEPRWILSELLEAAKRTSESSEISRWQADGDR